MAEVTTSIRMHDTIYC